MKRIFTAVLLLSAAGCAGPRPDAPVSAAVAPPAQWRGDSTASVLDSADWWKGFGDPTLDQLVQLALVHNVDIAVASERVAAAAAQLQSAKANLLPNVTLGFAGGRDEEVSPIGTPLFQNSSVGQLHGTYDPDLFGELHDLERAAKAGLLGLEAQRANVRLIIASATATTYINLVSADARLQILRDTLVARQESLKFATRRAEAGYATQLDLKQAEAEFHAAEQLIPANELLITQLEDALSELIGANPQSIARDSSLDRLETPAVPVRLPAELLRRRPDIIVAEQQVVAADEGLDASRAAFLPHIELTASGGFAYSTAIVSNPINLFQIGGSILAPIFDAGRLRAQENIAVARRDEAAFEYRRVALRAFKEVEDALAGQTRLSQQEVSLTAERDSLRGALAIAKNRYRLGYSPYLEQLDAERSLLAVNLQLAQLRADRLSESIKLYQALGGAWEALQRPG